MKEILLMDFKNIIKSSKFKFVSIVIFIIPTIGFLMSCKFYYGLPIQFIRSALEENFLNGMVSRSIKLWFLLILPLLSIMVCSDIYSNQYNNAVYKSILTRCKKSTYILSKIIIVFTLTFSVIFISLIINQVLFLITFPIEGIDNARNLPSFDIGYLNYEKERFIDIIRIKNIGLYNLIYMAIYGLIGGLYSLTALSVSFFIKNAKIFIVALFIVYFGVYQIFITLGLEKFHINSYLDGDSVGNIIFIVWIFILLLIPSILSLIKYKSQNEI